MIFWSCFRNIMAINESESHLVKKQSKEEEKTDYFHQKTPDDWINIEPSRHFNANSHATYDEMDKI